MNHLMCNMIIELKFGIFNKLKKIENWEQMTQKSTEILRTVGVNEYLKYPSLPGYNAG